MSGLSPKRDRGSKRVKEHGQAVSQSVTVNQKKNMVKSCFVSLYRSTRLNLPVPVPADHDLSVGERCACFHISESYFFRPLHIFFAQFVRPPDFPVFFNPTNNVKYMCCYCFFVASEEFH